ncbi:Kruppel-like factor 18 [Mus caroli]|uniref:Kruppel-like factor 18 n=1 Tax=Mus caroli TaxID=10089 RepID=A0A6P5PGQ5_MUSCR|nr:Kruppel-like factor 18 [Mus caroli]
MEMAENTSASKPGPYNTQPSPVESSQLVSGQSSEMLTSKQTVMASASYSTQETTCTQNSTAYPGKAIGFHFGDPFENTYLNQQVVSAEQKIPPAGLHHMQLNSTPKVCLPPQMTTRVDTRETFYNEDYWMRTLNSDKTLLFQNTAMCENQRVTFDNHQTTLYGSHAGQDPKVGHVFASVHDQTSDDSQMTIRNGGHLTLYGSQMTAPSCSQTLHPNQIITSFSEQNYFEDQQSNLAVNNGFYGDQVILPNGSQAFYESQMRANFDQSNDQMKSFSGQNVCKGQENLLSGECSLSGYQTSGYRCDQDLIVNPQVTSPFGGQPLSDFQIQTSSFDTTLPGSKRTRSSAEDNLTCPLETSPSSEETFYLGQMRTSVDQNVYPRQNGTPKSLDRQVTSFSLQAPYVSESSYPSLSPLIKKQPQENSSASSLVQRQHPEMNLDFKTQSPVSQKNSSPSKLYFCTYEGCRKVYKRPNHLKEHQRKHTDKRKYTCDEPGCTWSFFRLCDLNRHKEKHSRERPYACPMCSANYSRLDYLTKHLEKKHG